MTELPTHALEKIYIEFLFVDFLEVFERRLATDEQKWSNKFCKGNHGLPACALKSLIPNAGEDKYRREIVKLLKVLEPRQYASGDVIQDQYDEVFEVLYIMKGRVGVGYRLYNEQAFGVVLQRGHVVNDYAVMTQRVSEFRYEVIIEPQVDGLAIRRIEFVKLLESQYWERMAISWQTNYQRRIQAPMVEHREDVAEKFAGTHSEKLCPVSAFGVGVAEKLYLMPRRKKQK